MTQTTGNKKYGVDLELTDEGAEKFKTATEEAITTIMIQLLFTMMVL